MANAKRDGNFVPTLIAVSNGDGTTPVIVYADPTTHRLLTSAVSSVNIAQEVLTATTSGSDITLDLTGLSHVFTSIVGIARNGLFVTPTSGDTSVWTRSGNTATVTNADAGSVYLVMYTY